MWEDFGVRETLGQVVKQEKNVIWLKKNNSEEKLHGR